MSDESSGGEKSKSEAVVEFDEKQLDNYQDTHNESDNVITNNDVSFVTKSSEVFCAVSDESSGGEKSKSEVFKFNEEQLVNDRDTINENDNAISNDDSFVTKSSNVSCAVSEVNGDDEDEDSDDENAPAKKKRRLKNEWTTGNLPERRSQRLLQKEQYCNEEKMRMVDLGMIRQGREWGEPEKKLFLEACKKYGTKDVDNICKHVHVKTPAMVKLFIKRQIRNLNYTIKTEFQHSNGEIEIIDEGEGRRGRKRYLGHGRIDLPDAKPHGKVVEVIKKRSRPSPIEKWLGAVENRHAVEEKALKDAGFSQAANYSSLVPQLLGWLAEGEAHPDPKDCQGVDYAAIYRWLAVLCAGEAPPDLSTATSERVSLLLPMLRAIMARLDLSHQEEFLRDYRGPFTKYRPAREGLSLNTERVKNIEDLAKVPGFNPLGMPLDMFVEREVPNLDQMIEMFMEDFEEEEDKDEKENVSVELNSSVFIQPIL